MPEFQLRGYMIAKTAEFLRETALARGMEDPSEKLSAPLRSALKSMTPVGWYPVAYIGELNRLVVTALAENDEERARSDLASCGKFLAEEATSTFMRLLMRVLTPGLFARKLPELWRRDCTYGKLDIQTDERTMTIRLSEMDGHDHIAAIMPGYTCFALEKMGKTVERVNVNGWSVSNPNASGTELKLFWKT